MAAAALVVAAELVWLRTGLLRKPAYWVSFVVIFAFMVPVDGWMSKLSDPIIVYDPDELSGWREPWDIPTEEFVYAWALLTLAMLLWDRAGRPEAERAAAGSIEG
ncbi:MAG: lycopene cyclase domain-containing protein [Acidimicrobiales bacterium]